MIKVRYIVLLVAGFLSASPLWSAQKVNTAIEISAGGQKSLEQTIPLTVANLKGHETLYDEGWFIITSSQKALQYARQHSIDSSAQAIQKLSESIKIHSVNYTTSLDANLSASVKSGKDIYKAGSENSHNILSSTNDFALKQWSFSKASAQTAWQDLITGYIYLDKNTEPSLNALSAIPTNYTDNIKSDHRQLFKKFQYLREKSTTNIKDQWNGALVDAQTQFKDAYIESAENNNSLSALGTLMWGYMKGFYLGLFKPAVNTSWQASKYSATVAGELVFLPIASGYILTKNTLRSSGLVLYYSGKAGIEVLSPSLKSGFHASLALLSAGTIPLTYVGGTTLGLLNQTASTVAAPVAATGQGVAVGIADTLQYGTLVTFDVIKGTTKVFVNQIQSGVVLGYNALTAIPSHLLLGTTNSVVFLFYDGPKLTLATIKGQVNYNGKDLQPGALPVGSVINLKALTQQGQVELQVISEDPEIINQVLTEMPKDLKK